MPAMTSIPLPSATSAPKRGRFTLALLVATFILPFLAGTGLFWSGWRPDKFGNHGELIVPPRAMPESGLRDADGGPLPTAALHGQWLLLLRVDGNCAASCRDTLKQMSQVHRALNKEQSRVRRVLIRNGNAVSDGIPGRADMQQVRALFPDLTLATIDDAGMGDAWSQAFEGASQGLFVADPLGNVILRYEAAAPMRGVLKDLERLLKYSWIQ